VYQNLQTTVPLFDSLSIRLVTLPTPRVTFCAWDNQKARCAPECFSQDGTA
jgi:hypothetical protein